MRSLARGHTTLCVKVLAGIVSQEAVPPAARVAAAGILLDRGWGKAPQAHSGEDGEGEIRVTIRHLVEGMPDEHKVIEGVAVKIDDATPAKIKAGKT